MFEMYQDMQEAARDIEALAREKWAQFPDRVKEEFEDTAGLPAGERITRIAEVLYAHHTNNGINNVRGREVLGRLAQMNGMYGWEHFRDGRGMLIGRAMAAKNNIPGAVAVAEADMPEQRQEYKDSRRPQPGTGPTPAPVTPAPNPAPTPPAPNP